MSRFLKVFGTCAGGAGGAITGAKIGGLASLCTGPLAPITAPAFIAAGAKIGLIVGATAGAEKPLAGAAAALTGVVDLPIPDVGKRG